MYDEMLVETGVMKSGNIGIKAPFNADFKNELKALVPSARWQSPYWIIDPVGLEQAERLLAKYYPSVDQLQAVKIEWELDRESPEIDGISLANISRDYWSWKKSCPVSFKIIEQSLDCGGSAKYPGLYGKLVIEAVIRDGANIRPRATVSVIEEGKAVNPLADFSTEELLAEIERRGDL